MVIFRHLNGRPYNFRLSDKELFAAYLEQQKKNDMEDIRSELEEYYKDDERYPPELLKQCIQDDNFLIRVHGEFRKRLDYDHFWFQLRECIEEELKKIMLQTKEA